MRTSKAIDRGLLVLRLSLGLVFVMHGWQKLTVMGPSGVAGFLSALGVPLPGLNAVLLIATELLGGLALIAGAFTRIAGALTAFAMLIAIATVHLPNGFFLPNGYEFALTMMLGSVAVALSGAGAYSLDARLAPRATRVIEADEPARIAA